VLALKTRDQIPARLTRLLASAQKRAPLDTASLIVPVPLHPSRQRERGFNQAAVVGQALAKENGLPIDTSTLVRAVQTERHRAGMDAFSRRASVENAFEVRRPRLIQAQNVLLVDDVFTTGATVSACARVLRDAGAQEVFVLTVARPNSFQAWHWRSSVPRGSSPTVKEGALSAVASVELRSQGR
jgi:ComF family protein